MQQRKSKKILIYFFLLLVVGSINNINLNGLKLQNINNINITGLDIKNKLFLFKEIENFNLNNIFLVNKIDLKEKIELNPLVENYFIFKKYPSSLDINIVKTKFLAKINKNGQIFYIGSNGKFIKNNSYLLKEKNVILSPHIAGLSDNYGTRHQDLLQKNIKNFSLNKKLINKIF